MSHQKQILDNEIGTMKNDPLFKGLTEEGWTRIRFKMMKAYNTGRSMGAKVGHKPLSV